MASRREQCWDPGRYDRDARFVSELGMPVVALLAPRDGERVLDLGCGDGVLTAKLSEYGCEVVGVDSSPAMVTAATALGIKAQLGDGECLGFAEEFDAVFSNAALHWMTRPDQVIEGVWRALKPGGRFVGEFGGHGNVSAIVGATQAALSHRGIEAPRPWYFPRPGEYRSKLQACGFVSCHVELIDRPTPVPTNIGDWLEIFAQPYLAAVPASDRNEFVAEIVESLRPNLCAANGDWTVDYVRLRFSAAKPITAKVG